MIEKYITLNTLQHYHNNLMKYLSNPHMIPINICTQCGGLLNENNTCDFCGTKFKLVVDKGDEQ